MKHQGIHYLEWFKEVLSYEYWINIKRLIYLSMSFTKLPVDFYKVIEISFMCSVYINRCRYYLEKEFWLKIKSILQGSKRL